MIFREDKAKLRHGNRTTYQHVSEANNALPKYLSVFPPHLLQFPPDYFHKIKSQFIWSPLIKREITNYGQVEPRTTEITRSKPAGYIVTQSLIYHQRRRAGSRLITLDLLQYRKTPISLYPYHTEDIPSSSLIGNKSTTSVEVVTRDKISLTVSKYRRMPDKLQRNSLFQPFDVQHRCTKKKVDHINHS